MTLDIPRRYEVLICECSSMNHQVVFWLDTEDNGQPMAYVHVALTNRPFWTRMKQAVRHILGKKSNYGHFDETLIDPRDAGKLRKIADHLDPERKY